MTKKSGARTRTRSAPKQAVEVEPEVKIEVEVEDAADIGVLTRQDTRGATTKWRIIDTIDDDGAVTDTMAMPCGLGVLVRSITRFRVDGMVTCMSEAITYIDSVSIDGERIIRR